MQSDEYEYIQSFLKTFKLNENIKGYQWTLKYNNDNEGILVMGDYPENYDDNYKNCSISGTKALNWGSLLIDFGLSFDEVILGKSKLVNPLRVLFLHELNAILVNFNLYDKIINESLINYVNSGICEKKWIFQQYGYVRCDASKFTQKEQKSFPSIYFKNKDLNYTFELNYNDLFTKEQDGYIYFLIFYDYNYDGVKIGKPFLKKYSFTVDNEKKMIFFYTKKLKEGGAEDNPDSSGSNKFIIILVLSLVAAILLGVSLVFGFKLYMKKKKEKKRANELDEDFEYNAKKDSNENSENKEKNENENLEDNRLGI